MQEKLFNLISNFVPWLADHVSFTINQRYYEEHARDRKTTLPYLANASENAKLVIWNSRRRKACVENQIPCTETVQ